VTDKQTEAASPAGSAQEVERIRDIIFGSQMRDYEQQFLTVQRDLERLQGEIERLNERLAEQDASKSKEIRDLRQEMQKADDEVRDELRESARRLTADKVDRTVLGELFIELGRQVKADGSLGDVLAGLGQLEQD
jgi:predicted  nucleic acid-binding Zn-ribbon protein